ncbi:phosphopantetheine-binding protein [Photorhabdus sp. SF281]|uniref:phosphopantetheine-binding protein n=1 Tax=Photorhabdus sp. SF281 TaxID=3459527 RepID=UPI0040450449
MSNKKISLDKLVDIIGIILNESDIRLDDNFVELGGNSIIAIQIAKILKESEGIEINLAQLLGDKIGNVKLINIAQ